MSSPSINLGSSSNYGTTAHDVVQTTETDMGKAHCLGMELLFRRTTELKVTDRLFAYLNGEQKEVYSGQTRDGVPHGHGLMSHPFNYEGYWQNGLPHGDGKMTHANGCVTSGEWKDGFLAYGLMQYPDGSEYIGPWRDGLPHGKGALTKFGARLTGMWQDGKLSGDVRISYQNSHVYEGALSKGAPHGQGKMTLYDGSSYFEGEWVEGRPFKGAIQLSGKICATFAMVPIFSDLDFFRFEGELNPNLFPTGCGKLHCKTNEHIIYGNREPALYVDYQGEWKALPGCYGSEPVGGLKIKDTEFPIWEGECLPSFSIFIPREGNGSPEMMSRYHAEIVWPANYSVQR